jgi:hypothetical protein
VNHGMALSPQWTSGGADTVTPGHDDVLTGAFLLAIPGLKSSPVGVEDGEGKTTTPF